MAILSWVPKSHHTTHVSRVRGPTILHVYDVLTDITCGCDMLQTEGVCVCVCVCVCVWHDAKLENVVSCMQRPWVCVSHNSAYVKINYLAMQTTNNLTWDIQ